MQKILRIDETDNLIVALKDLHAGEVYQWGDESITLVTDVKAKHKFALEAVPEGGIVSMYGTAVGKATKPIARGEVITVDNIRHYAARYHWRRAEAMNGRSRMCRPGKTGHLKVMSVMMAGSEQLTTG